jgi:integrase
MTVRYRPERGAWYVDVVVNHPDGTWERIRARSPVNRKRNAEEHERQLIEEALAHRKNPQPPERRVKEFAKEFLKTYAVANNKPSEVDTKDRILRLHIVPALGDLLLSEVTAHRIEQFKAEKLRTGLSAKRVNNIVAVLHRMLVVAYDWGFLREVPRGRLLKLPPRKFDLLSFEEAERLVGAAEPDWRTMIVVALRTGMRLGEIRALEWDDVDLVAGRVLVRRSAWLGKVGSPKSGKAREIPLSDEAMLALRNHRHLRGPLVFCDRRGKMHTEKSCMWPLYRSCKRAGLRRISWRVCRHTFASHLVMRGVALKAVQEMLGHSTIQMTMRYAHLGPDVARNAVRLLDLPSTVPVHGTSMAPAEGVS